MERHALISKKVLFQIEILISLMPSLIGHFIKMDRFDRKQQRFREDSVSHG
jgi:hypothetical protein